MPDLPPLTLEPATPGDPTDSVLIFAADGPDQTLIAEVYGDAMGPAVRDRLGRVFVASVALVAALTRAEELLVTAMHQDLRFDGKTRREIIDGHPDIVAIRQALAQADGC